MLKSSNEGKMMAVVRAMKEASQEKCPGDCFNLEDRQADIPEGDTNEPQRWSPHESVLCASCMEFLSAS